MFITVGLVRSIGLFALLTIVVFQYGIWGGDSRERLHYDAIAHDIGEIIANCASTHWADRKDGLIGLQYFFRDGRSDHDHIRSKL